MVAALNLEKKKLPGQCVSISGFSHGRGFISCVALTAIVAGAGAGSATAQDLEPRSYTNLPISQTFLVLGAGRSEGDLSPTPTSPLQDAELTVDVALVGMARTFALAGSAAKLDLLTSRVCFDGSATFDGEPVDGQRCEYGDPRLKLTWNFYGAPALEIEEFSSWNEGLVMGGSLQVSIPAGAYSSDHLINAGTNRWILRPGFGMSYRLGNWYIDGMTSIHFFEDNDKAFRGSNLEQDPIYAVQSHLIYSFGRGRWISLNANYFYGGESTVNGVKADDLQSNSRWGITYSMPITRHQSIKLNVNTGVVTRVGNDFDSYSLAWLYRF